MGQRKAVAQKIMEADEGIRLVRQGGKTQSRGQPPNHGVFIHGLRQIGQLSNAAVCLRQGQGVIEQHREQDKHS